jgi:hypothetical protein
VKQLSGCNGGACPAVYEDDGSIIVQGTAEPGGGVGEARVRIPLIVLVEAARALTESAVTEPMRAVPEGRPVPVLWSGDATQVVSRDWFRRAG